MKEGVRARYWSKFKARKKHFLSGKYRLKKNRRRKVFVSSMLSGLGGSTKGEEE